MKYELPYIIFIGSTGGSVLSRLLKHEFVREGALEALSDRTCGFIEVAQQHGVPATILPATTGQDFSNLLHARFEGRQDVVFLSFYTRLFRGAFLRTHRGRVFNCHPSLLPAFGGLHGFEDTLSSSALFMGSTLHLVDEGMDSGGCVLQAALPLDRSQPLAVLRHHLFLTQVYGALQFIRWIRSSRIESDDCGRVTVLRARYEPSVFSPNLDPDFFEFIGGRDELGTARPKGAR